MADETEGKVDAIKKGVFNPNTKEVFVDFAQLGLGALFNAEVLKEIPFVKTAIAGHKTFVAFRDQLFQTKVEIFIYEGPTITPEESEKFLRSLDGPAMEKKLFDAIILYLDKLDNMEKPIMMKQMFVARVRGQIDNETFLRLMNAINIGFIEDLKALAGLEDVSPQGATWKATPKLQIYHSLLQTGLTGIKRSSGTVAILGVSFEVTELGKTFIRCMNT